MARYINTIPTRKSPEELTRSIERYLREEGFKLFDPDQNIWKKGMGWMLGPQFIRFEVDPRELYLEAWIKFALLPGVYMGEMGIVGAFAFIPKRKLKARVIEIERMAE